MPLTRFPAFKVVRMFRLLIHRAEHVGKVHQAEAATGRAAQAFLVRNGIAGDADDCLLERNNAHRHLQTSSATNARATSKAAATISPSTGGLYSSTGTFWRGSSSSRFSL